MEADEVLNSCNECFISH